MVVVINCKVLSRYQFSSVAWIVQCILQLHTFKGPHWCDFCANFLWGLIAQGVKCQGIDHVLSFSRSRSRKLSGDKVICVAIFWPLY